MGNEVDALLIRVVELRGQVSAITNRLCQDARQLADVQQDVLSVLERLTTTAKPEALPPASHRPSSEAPRVLRVADVSKRVGLCRSSVWRMVKEGDFPAPRRLSSRAVGWLEGEIDDWVRSRAAT